MDGSSGGSSCSAPPPQHIAANSPHVTQHDMQDATEVQISGPTPRETDGAQIAEEAGDGLPRVPSSVIDGVNKDASQVGHEVAPRRTTRGPNDITYYARLHQAADELADNAASDVRRATSTFGARLPGGGGDGEEVVNAAMAPDYEDIAARPPPPSLRADKGGGVSGRRVSGGASGPAIAPTQAPSTISTSAFTRQPCHGTQVDADADITTAAEGADDATMDMAAENTRGAAAAPDWSKLPQAAHGTADVTVTLLPMQALAHITVPVHNPNLYRSPLPRKTRANKHLGGSGGAGGSSRSSSADSLSVRGTGSPAAAAAAPHWVLMAKDLFEGLAQHLGLHPESFHVFHQHKRLRFMGTLFLDCDVTSAPGGGGGAAAPTENTRADPLWVSVAFPILEDKATAVVAAAAAAAEAGDGGAKRQVPFPSALSHAAKEEAEEAQASMAAVPSHLAHLGPEDYVARCIQVRRRKFEIPPQSLVEGRRQGYSYDEVMRQMQVLHDIADNGGKEGEASNFVTVAIVRDGAGPTVKPFLGGYCDKRRTSHVLLHAATQLYHRDLEYSPFARTGAVGPAAGDRTSRQTQTSGISRSCQTHREACAQTPRVDLLLETAHDFVVVARPYFSAAALRTLQDEMAVVMQKLYRQWKARRVRAALEAAESARQHRASARQRREEALHAALEDAAQLRLEDPRSAADFERVKQDIVAWRAEEAARIQRDTTLSPADARIALLALTKKELQLLQQLDQRRLKVGKTREEAAFVHKLDCMSAPKRWGTVHVVTPETERAGELRDLYDRLVETNSAVAMRTANSKKAGSSISARSTINGSPNGAKSVNASEASRTAPFVAIAAEDGFATATAARLDILLRVKWTVHEFSATSALARELGELIDREADLLHRGRRDASLSGLRQRIQMLFAEFVEDPAFNPGVKDFVQTARGRARVKAVEAERSLKQSKTQRSFA